MSSSGLAHIALDVAAVAAPANLKPIPPPAKKNCSCFGRAVSCLWPDYVFGTAETIGGAGLIYTGATATWLPFGALAIMELAIGLGHGLYRRYRPYADLNAEVEALRHNADQWQLVVAQEKQTTAQVTSELEITKKDAEAYKKENEELKGTIDQLKATAQSFDQNVLKYTQKIAQLEQVNVKLESDVVNLQAALKTLKETLAALVQANLQLKTSLTGVQEDVSALGVVDEQFAKITDSLDARFRGEVTDLAKQVTLAQVTTGNIIELLYGECQRLQTEIDALKENSSHLADTEAQLEHDEQEIQRLQQLAKEREDALAQATKGFAPVIAAIDRQLPQLQHTQEQLTGAASALSADGDQLSAAKNEFSQDIADLSPLIDRMQAALDKSKVVKKPGDT